MSDLRSTGAAGDGHRDETRVPERVPSLIGNGSRFGASCDRPLVLASASPRRHELLGLLGLPFRVIVADVDESLVQGEAPELMVRRLAIEKARAVSVREPASWVIGADTTVVLREGESDRILGKPADRVEAERMLAELAGRDHLVFTGFAVRCEERGVERSEVVATRVWFKPLSREEIRAYVATGEPLDKAGSYGVQGVASAFVSRLDGSFTNVVGLPLAELHSVMKDLAAWKPAPDALP